MRVLIPAALRSYTGAAELELELAADAATLAGMFDALDLRHPGLRFRVVDERGELRPNMRLFLNGLGVRDLGVAVKPGDYVAVVLALSGG